MILLFLPNWRGRICDMGSWEREWCSTVMLVSLWLCACDYVNTQTCVCVCGGGGGTDIVSIQHWYVSIMCLHTVSSMSLGLYSIDMWALCVYALLVLCHWAYKHWFVSIMCLHTVTSLSLGLHSIDMWALCVYTLLFLYHWAYTALICEHYVSTHCYFSVIGSTQHWYMYVHTLYYSLYVNSSL